MRNTMKHDPIKKLGPNASFMEVLMMPFAYEGEGILNGPDWDKIDAVRECIDELKPEEQWVIYEIFYDRNTYEGLAANLGIKAKSHAWRKTKLALDSLRKKLEQHPLFTESKETQ